jgi:hypothetical protein
MQQLSQPERLRRACEELGPTFVKLGQLAAARTRILPPEFTDELAKLQDQVAPIAFSEVHSVREMLLSADVGRAHRNRIHQELSEMEHVGRRLNSAGFDWHTNKPLKFAAGTAGLHVALEYCPGEAAARTMSQPTPPATRAHGCAGCAASGTTPDWLAIGIFVVVWRYRRPRRASKTIAASATTRGPRSTQVRAAPPSG